MSGYSSSEDSMDCLSMLIVIAAASMIAGVFAKVFIILICYSKSLHCSHRKSKNIMKNDKQ